MGEPLLNLNFARLNDYLDRIYSPEYSDVTPVIPVDKTRAIIEILDALQQAQVRGIGRTPNRQRFYEWSRKSSVVSVPMRVVLHILEILHGCSPADDRQRAVGWTTVPTERGTLLRGDAEKGEIEIVGELGENLIGPQHAPVDNFVAVHVDRVRFRQRNTQSGEVMVRDGQYVRIETPGNPSGAVVLPVDRIGRRVLLVTQYRHAPRAWITEAPRGFGVIDDDAAATARRELAEETGARVLWTSGREELYALRSLYTDTGKMLDRPTFFLAFIDDKLAEDRLLKLGPLMEDPVWVPLKDFYRAIHARDGVQVEPDSVEFVFSKAVRSRFFAQVPIEEESRLFIEDMFTITAGLLALPEIDPEFTMEVTSPFNIDVESIDLRADFAV